MNRKVKSRIAVKSRWSAPNPECISDNSEWFSFSFSPDPNLKVGAGRQPDPTAGPGSCLGANDFLLYYDMLFATFNNICVRMVPEISSIGRWHFHGIIKFKDIMKAYMIDMAKMRDYGSYEIDKIQMLDEEGNFIFPNKWFMYMYKQKEYMVDYLQMENAKMYEIDTYHHRYVKANKQKINDKLLNEMFEPNEND